MSFLWFWLFSSIFESAFLASRTVAVTDDGKTLLQIKSELNDTGNALYNWDTTEFYCNWTGIRCREQDHRVIFVNLPYLHLGGVISGSVGKLQRLQRLALHHNLLQGKIPSEIGNCTELRALYLRDNHLDGGIPPLIGNLALLAVLDLSSNMLGGAIPATVGYLYNLHFLNFSNNRLSGEIPNFGALGKFGNTSFLGNVGLCGPLLLTICGTSQGFPVVLPHAERDGSSLPTNRSAHYVVLIICAVSSMALLLVILLSFLWICLRSKTKRVPRTYAYAKPLAKQESTPTKLITFHGDLLYPSCEIIEKLESLDEENIVGSGGFGTVYRMVMNDCGTFAVKRMDRCGSGSEKIFERQLEILGSIKHINLLNLRGYCRLLTSKLLIYDFMKLGNLHDILHNNAAGECCLNWNARVRIALGSARALAYLHDCCPKIIHQDMKSSNILLDEKLEPSVSDFGLAKLMVDGDANTTTVVAGTFGYLAPEYLHSGKPTEKSDVYSFGVVLLEIVTGKTPTDQCFVSRGLNIVGWMNTVLLGGERMRLEDVLDRRCSDADLDGVGAVLDIAMRCTEAEALKRPSMKQVLQFLEQEVMTPCPSENDLYDSHSFY